MSKSEIREYYADEPVQPTIENYEIEGHTINYATVGNDSLPTIIFFHGAPGSWSAFKHFLKNEKLLDYAKVVSVDRPGYGHADFGNSVPSLEDQSKILAPILKKYSETPTILVGHSLGGPMIARLAMDYPELCSALVMVAPSIDPDLEPNESWFRFPLHTPFFRWLLPISFRVTNDEIYFLEDELRKMLPLWKNIKQPVTIIQGTDDKLVPPGNADFAKKMLINSDGLDIVLKEDMNHFVPWNNPQLIEEAILKYIK